MAEWIPLDVAAVTITDDSPLSAAAMVQLRENVQAASDDRFQRGGANYPIATISGAGLAPLAPRWCSAFPVAWGPFLVRLDPYRPIQKADVRIRGIVDWTLDAANPPAVGTPVMNISVTCADLTSRTVVPQWRGRTGREWTDPNFGGTELTYNTVEQTIDVVASVNGLNSPIDREGVLAGWVAFFVWTWSRPRWDANNGVVLEDEVADLTINVGGSGELGAEGDFVSLANFRQSERGLAYKESLEEDSTKNPIDAPVGSMYHIPYWRPLGFGGARIRTVPPLITRAEDMVAAPQLVHIYELGVLQAHSIDIRPRHGTISPGKEVFYIDRPAWATNVSRLGIEADHLGRQRWPTYMSRPAQDYDWPADAPGANQSARPTEWRIFSRLKRFGRDPFSPNFLDSLKRMPEWVSLFSAIVRREDITNVRALSAVAWLLAYQTDQQPLSGESPEFLLRVVPFNAETNAQLLPRLWSPVDLAVQNSVWDEYAWTPLVQCGLRALRYDDLWDFRGCVVHPDVFAHRRPPDVQDWLMPYWVGTSLDLSSDIVGGWPEQIRVDLQLSVDRRAEGISGGFEVNTDLVVLGGGVAGKYGPPQGGAI